MKNLIILLIVTCSFLSFGQKVQHTIGIVPLSLNINKGFSVAQGLNYIIEYKKNAIFFSMEGTIFKSFDVKKRNSDIEKYIPFLNQTKLEYGRKLFNQTNDRKINNFQLLIGYHFLQHATESFEDYWHVDSLPNNGVRVLSGFQTHSAKIGVNWSSTKYRQSDVEKLNPKSRNTFELDYLFGLAIKLKGYDDYITHQVNTDIANAYKFNRNGVRFAYKYELFLSNKVSLYSQIELLYAPFIKYVPNKKLYVPRGGEMINPFFPSLKIGVNIFI